MQAVTGIFHAIFGGGGPKQIAAPLPAARDDTQAMVDQQDALARRKGGAADILTGTSAGAEAAPGSTGRLVIGS
jgi:hypothetical protein